MGTHNRRPTTNLSEKTKVVEPDKLPNNIGKRRRITTINGIKRYFIIEDEILHKRHNNPRKLIAFQRFMFEKDDRIEYRLGYYMVGVKPGAKGRWVCLGAVLSSDPRERPQSNPEGSEKEKMVLIRQNQHTQQITPLIHDEWNPGTVTSTLVLVQSETPRRCQLRRY
jgi:hypothetical protein